MAKATKSFSFQSDSRGENVTSSRREERLALCLPVRLIQPLTNEIDETIPGVLISLSASGIQILTDERFSLFLPPQVDTHLEVEFFLDEVEIRQVPIQITRVEKSGMYQLTLGCRFIDLPSPARLALRGEVARRLAARR